MSVAEQRNYRVLTVQSAKQIARSWLEQAHLHHVVAFGLPEVDDRYHLWRVPLLHRERQDRLGEVVIDAYTALVQYDKSSTPATIEARLRGSDGQAAHVSTPPLRSANSLHTPLCNTIALGDCEEIVHNLPDSSVDLVFTSPPYYNARPEYTDFVTYEKYLLKIRNVLQQVHRILAEGRFLVMNVSPVLIRRTQRSEPSRRVAVPFDMHRLFVETGYDFIDDIIWEKPAGAGWATSRGRRFAADRQPLQYKPVPVTEYILVYRKHTSKLIDWNIRSHPQPDLVEASRIHDGYERTNIWRIKPAYDKRHPAIFPTELAERVIRYYSFIGDVVLDPFAGIGTVGKAAAALERRFVLIEREPNYVEVMLEEARNWPGVVVSNVLTINCEVPPIATSPVTSPPETPPQYKLCNPSANPEH